MIFLSNGQKEEENPNYDFPIEWTLSTGISSYQLQVYIWYDYYDPVGNFCEIDFDLDTLVNETSYVIQAQDITTLPVIVDSLVWSNIYVIVTAENYNYESGSVGNIQGDGTGYFFVNDRREVHIY